MPSFWQFTNGRYSSRENIILLFTCFVINNIDPNMDQCFVLWTSGPYCNNYDAPYWKKYMQFNIGGRYIKCSESSRLSILQHSRQCTRDLCTLFHYHEATMLHLFTILFSGESYNERAQYNDVLIA